MAVLVELGFGSKFIAWVKLLYAKPLACFYVNNIITDTFEIGRGTQQGCPLSHLFAISIEPLAALIIADQIVK